MEKTKNTSVVCQNCGGQIDVNALEETVECPFCGASYSVSNLLNESDAVKIEKIRTNAQQKIEQEKLNHEKEQNKSQEEKDEIEKFKKSKFSKVLIVFSVIGVLFLGTAFNSGKILAGLVGIIMTAGFIATYLMKSHTIKEPKKGISSIIAVVAFLFIIPYFSLYNMDDYGTKAEKINWNDVVMGEVLPEPKKKKGNISTNSDKYLSVYIKKISKEDYKDYVEECKKKGFTVDSKNDTNSYDAYNSKGYKLRIYYSDYSKEYNISLDAPISMTENAWRETPLSKLLTKPKSNIGKVESDSDKYYTYDAGNTSKEEFSEYASSILNLGFSNNYSKGDDYFHGTNSDGYKVDISYKGNNTMRISITAPEKKETTNSNNTTENTKPTEENKTETPQTTKPTETIPSNNNNNTNGIGKEFKQAMDSYETFMDEYIAFMKKYQNSNGTDMSLLTDYSKYMSKYAQVCEDFAKWENADINTAEMTYYLEVQTRVSKKLLEVAQ